MFDPSLCAYLTSGGQMVRLAPPGGSLSPLEFKVDTQGNISTLTVSASNEDGYDLTAVRWRVTPTPKTYNKQVLTGRTAVFRADPPSSGQSQVTAFVPSTSGEQQFNLIVNASAMAQVANLFPKTVSYGNEALKIETSFGFGTAKTGVPVRLVRIMSPGSATERTIIASRTVDFPAGQGVALSETITFPTTTGLGSGYEYRWEADLSPTELVHSRELPIFILGDDPRCAPQALSQQPNTLSYPSVYTRKASDTPPITPSAGYTYQQYVDRHAALWKATHLGGAAPGGGWLSFNDYYSNIYWVDLDDTTIPRHTVNHWDVWGWGYDLAGWYGNDSSAQPYPRVNIARDIPIPHNAAPAVGTDRSLCIVGMRGGQIETIWEMWLAWRRGNGEWEAASIGKTSAAEDWRHSVSYTVAASGISALAYALRIKEAQAAVNYIKAERAAGRTPSEAEIVQLIPHSLSVNMPNPRAGTVSYPATFSDGSDPTPTTPAEGQKVYLKSTFDVVAQNYKPLTHAIAVVGKHRGFLVTDRTSWSSTIVVEGDQSYGGGVWSTIRDPSEPWAVQFPDDQWVIGRTYATRAEWDADTT